MSKHVEHIAEEAIKTKKHFKNSTFVGGLLPTLSSTLILFIATLIVGGPDKLPAWFSWIMVIVYCITITYSLVIAQKRHLVGEYGETILILIPTFVWLMGGTFWAQEILLFISVALVVLGTFLYAFAWVAHSKKNEEIGKVRVQLMIRFAFVCITVAATVIISLILLNWAYGSVHFQREFETLADGTTEAKDNYVSTSWILFIAIVTILSAVMLVMIGLTRTTKEDAKWFRLHQAVRHLFKKSKVGHTTVFELNPTKQSRRNKRLLRKSLHKK